MKNTKQLGIQAEKIACEFLQSQGLSFLAQNHRSVHGEIDLIMNDRDDIVFVEVRCRSRIDYGTAGDSITKTKMKKLIKTAQLFLQSQGSLYKVSSRFDVIAIHHHGYRYEIDWIKNAFLVEL